MRASGHIWTEINALRLNFVRDAKAGKLDKVCRLYITRALLLLCRAWKNRETDHTTIYGQSPISLTGLIRAILRCDGNDYDHRTAPIISPDTMSSTRRFCCRPSAVSFDAIGCAFPRPRAVTDAAGMPCFTR